MAVKIDFETVSGETYDIQYYDEDTSSWVSLATGVADTAIPYTDTNGTASTKYQARTVGTPNSPWTPTFYGTPTSPDMCTVTGYLYKLDGTPFQDEWVIFRKKDDQSIGGIHFSIPEEIETQTDGDGKWSQALPQGATVTIIFPSLQRYEDVTIPNSASASFDSLL